MIAAATAEVPEHLDKFRASTGFSDTVIVDPENELAKHLKKKELLDVAITDSQLYQLRGYKHGLAQPALLVMKRDGTVLQRWAIVPSIVSNMGWEPGGAAKLTSREMNIGGATDRPVLAEVWRNVQKQLRGEDVSTKQAYTTTGVLHLLNQKLFGR